MKICPIMVNTFPYINIYIKQEFEKSFKIVTHKSLVRSERP